MSESIQMDPFEFKRQLFMSALPGDMFRPRIIFFLFNSPVLIESFGMFDLPVPILAMKYYAYVEIFKNHL